MAEPELKPQREKLFQFVHTSWMGYVSRLKQKFCDDHQGLMDLKTAYWAGAQTYSAAVHEVLEQEHLTEEQRLALIAELDRGLQGFAATLNPLRKLN